MLRDLCKLPVCTTWLPRRKLSKRSRLVFVVTVFFVIVIFRTISEENIYLSYPEEFFYPLEVDMKNISRKILAGEKVDIEPLNKFSFHYVYNPRHLCNGSSIYLLILIKSDVQHNKLRSVIRKTLLYDLYMKKGYQDVRVAFLLGSSLDQQFLIADENLIYGDIIQQDFKDAYRNNTLKTMMGFDWVCEFCRNAKYIFFVDDDMIVNIKILRKFLQGITSAEEATLYSGLLVVRGPPERTLNNKWSITRQQYPFDVYPDYIAGCSVIMSQNTVQAFRSVFPYVQYYPFDDVYLGFIARKLDIIPLSNKFLENAHRKNVSRLPYMIANHGFHDSELYYKTYRSLFRT